METKANVFDPSTLNSALTTPNVLPATNKPTLSQRISWDALLASPNCQLFYQTIQRELEVIFISAKAAAGGFTEIASGRINQINSIFSCVSRFVSLTPWVGSTLTTLLQIICEKTIKKIDEWQQQHIINHLANIGSLQDLSSLARNIARQLTIWYAPQLRLLPPSPAFALRLTPQNASIYYCGEIKQAATQRFAAVVLIWLLEALKTQPVIASIPLSTQLVQFVTIQKSLPRFNSTKSTLMQLQKSIRYSEYAFHDLLSHLFIDTEQQESLFLPDFFMRSGIQTVDGRYYGGNGTEPHLYGYCYGTLQAARARGLQRETVKESAPKIEVRYY